MTNRQILRLGTRPSMYAALAIMLWCVVVGSAYVVAVGHEHEASQRYAGGRFAVTDHELSREATEWAAISAAVNPDSVWEGQYLIENAGDAMNFALLSFVDFCQVETSVNAQTAYVQLAEVERSTAASAQLRFPPVSSGAHDVMQLLIWEPYRHDRTGEWRTATHDKDFTANRIELIAGQGEKEDLPRMVIEDPRGGATFDGVISNLSATQDNLLWFEHEAPEEHMIPFYIHVGNPSDTAQSFAIITLVDWIQCPFTNAGETIVRVDVPPRTTVTIPARVAMPSGEAAHEMQVFRILAPGDPKAVVGDNSPTVVSAVSSSPRVLLTSGGRR